MIDNNYRHELITDFKGAVLSLDQPDAPREAALLAQNVDYYAGVVRTRLGFTSVLGTILEPVTAIYNWISSLGNYLLRFRSADRSVHITNISTGADAVAIAGDLIGYSAIFADAGARIYAAIFGTDGRGATAARSIVFQSSAFVSDKLFQGPITYTPFAPSEPSTGDIEPGLHKLGYRIEYRNGFITRPSPDSGIGFPSTTTFQPINFTAAGSKNAAWTLNTTWPTGAVKVYVIMSPVSNPARFFYVPGASATVTGGTSMSVTITFSISDEDLYASEEVTSSLTLMTNDVSGLEQIRPYVVLTFGDRMVYVAQIADTQGNLSSAIFASEKSQYQAITADQSLIQLPGAREITTAISLDGQLYMFGPHWTYRTLDSGDVPVAWPAPILVDGTRGTLATRGAEVSPSGQFAWVADQGGLYWFNGAFPDVPLSYYQQSDWDRINWEIAEAVIIKDDATNHRVNVFAALDGNEAISHILSWNYVEGTGPTQVKYSLNDIRQYGIGAAEIVQNTSPGATVQSFKHKELWLGPSDEDQPLARQANLGDAAPHRDLGPVGIAAVYQTYQTPDKPTAPGQLFQHHGINVRLRGEGSIIVSGLDLDNVYQFYLLPINLRIRPGEEYFRGCNLISEGVSYKYGANLAYAPSFEPSAPTPTPTP